MLRPNTRVQLWPALGIHRRWQKAGPCWMLPDRSRDTIQVCFGSRPARFHLERWPQSLAKLGLGEFQAVPSRAFLDSLSPSPIRQAELIELMRLCRFNDVDFPLSETTDSEATWLFCALLSHESRMPIVTLPSLNRYFSQMRHIGRLARRLPFAPADVDAFVWQACANYMEFADDDGKYYLSQDTALYVEETPITVMLAYFERVARDLQFDRQRLMWWLERLTRPFGEFGGASSWIRHLVLNLCTGSIDESSRLGAVRREFGWATFVCETTLMGSSCTLDYMIRNLKSGYGQSVVVIGNRTPSLTVRRIGEFAEDSVVFALDARSCPIGPYNATPHKMRGAKFELDCLLMGHRHFVWDALDTTASLLSVVEWGGFLSARDLLRLNRSQELPRATIIWTCE